MPTSEMKQAEEGVFGDRKFLAKLKVGDRVIVETRYNGGYVAYVSKATKLSVDVIRWVDDPPQRFSRKYGRPLGKFMASSNHLREATEGALTTVLSAALTRRLRDKFYSLGVTSRGTQLLALLTAEQLHEVEVVLTKVFPEVT